MSAPVRIACRVRPFINSESQDDSVEVLDDSSLSVVNPVDAGKRFRFNFTSVHGQDATQEQVFESDVRPLLPSVFTGHTLTIFAYGVTSSGKTHTMQGSATQPGIIPRVMEALFERRVNMRSKVKFELSYMEIYKDDVFDLMVSTRGTKLPVREDGKGKVFVANLTETPIESTDEFDTHFIAACKGRSVAATNFNRASSRSHAILGIKVSVTENYPGAPILTGKVNLVDLAGSENNKMTGNDSIRMAESAAINKSLSVLGQVVHALNQRASRVPYRDSKLTRILQDALGGTSISLLICNIAPGAKFKQDTLNTLNFATRTKEIENRPVVNQQAPVPVPAPAPTPSLSTSGSRRSLGIGRPRPSLATSASQSSLPISVSTSGIPAPSAGHSRRLSMGAIGMRHVSAGPATSGAGVVGASRIQAPKQGRRASSAGYGSHSRRSSVSSVNNNGGAEVIGFTEEEMEAKIASAVEAALAKREDELREKAREEMRLLEEERKRLEQEGKRIDELKRQEEERRRNEEVEKQRKQEEEEERKRIEEEERRRQEREILKQQEEEWQRRRAAEAEDSHSRPPSYTSVAAASSQLGNQTMEVEMATPSVRRHANLSLLTPRVDFLDQSREPTDAEIAINMDYTTRKKVAKSLIKRARMYQQQDDLPTALQYYLKAQPYAADNLKLQHRIDKIREAIETGRAFVPSPPPEGNSQYNCDSLAFRTIQTPSRKRGRMSALQEMTNSAVEDEDAEMSGVDEMGMKRRRSMES
ncbi:Kinesin-like protein KIF22 OS=Danio rerio GN=kif22 PE=2 SV=1 [Rhizoctonia solani AG-1 IB]|uniref:Kinesin-like protein n=1 Tax=Thanatephorus cucumeris (strain AG1-IB / isolate 7/3/14) TaxID=1108050 RepID=M5BKL4_THACB|nr:Kinesin-like protein KIF22 [Rhizoctonia solani AG-1 IB]CEL58177.1 Kinesin-like protein KIF22 OS=Danio rerio GN=kif22 PE=2 SV=1 [Rhizoctonia solani AG-1 IB]